MFDLHLKLQLESLQSLDSNMLATMGYPTERKMSMRLKHTVMKESSKPKPKPRVVQSLPVDANELTRRLHVVLAEQRAQSERKRRTKAEGERQAKSTIFSKKTTKDAIPPATGSDGKPPSSSKKMIEAPLTQQIESSSPKLEQERTTSKKSNGADRKSDEGKRNISPSYHHIPQVAASQFTSTTTVGTQVVDKLCKKAVDVNLAHPNANRDARTANPTTNCSEQAKTLRRAQSMRERQSERSQLHDPLPTTLELDMRPNDLPNDNKPRAHLRARELRSRVKDARRKSTGSILGRDEPYGVDVLELCNALFSSQRPAVTGDPDEHRVDWTQSDELMAAKSISISRPSRPELLRRPESRWTLRRRLGSFGRHPKYDKTPSPIEEKVPHDLSPRSPRSPISEFLCTMMK